MLDRLLGWANSASRIVVWAGGGLLIFAALLTTADVLLRKIVNWSFGGADEIAGYLFAAATAFALAFAMLQRAHVRIDALYMTLPRPLQLALDVIGFLALGGFIGLIAWRAFWVWQGSFVNDSVSITPLVTPLDVPQGFWLAGLLFFMVVFVILLLRVGQAIVQRDWVTMTTLIGARLLEEEIKEETEHAREELEREHALMQGKPHGGD